MKKTHWLCLRNNLKNEKKKFEINEFNVYA